MSSPERARRVRVLVVDDSPVARELLAHILSSDPAVEVVGCAGDGVAALEAVRNCAPDIVTMDVNMPRMSGPEATRRIMETRALPIVIVTGCSRNMETSAAFGLLEAGALAVIAKPAGPGHPGHAAAARELLQTVKSMAEVKVVTRWPKSPAPRALATSSPTRIADTAPVDMRLVAIGASTGGPIAVKTILAGLPAGFPAPVLIVQHIANGFTEGLVDWLQRASGFRVRLAGPGEVLERGTAYVAPDGTQMGLADESTLSVVEAPPENGHRPSVSHLFRSVARTLGPRAVGVLLTGMGKDGAEELGQLRDKGALTIAQDAESSVVHGMPREAIALQAASLVLSPPEIALLLTYLARKPKRKT